MHIVIFQHFSIKVKQVFVQKFELDNFQWELETKFDLSYTNCNSNN